jgi:hypothetical protein
MTDSKKLKKGELLKSGDDFSDKPLKDKIGSDLKRLYDDVVNEDIPDDFLSLLAKADQQDS